MQAWRFVKLWSQVYLLFFQTLHAIACFLLLRFPGATCRSRAELQYNLSTRTFQYDLSLSTIFQYNLSLNTTFQYSLSSMSRQEHAALKHWLATLLQLLVARITAQTHPDCFQRQRFLSALAENTFV
jgi:hypothetical protein